MRPDSFISNVSVAQRRLRRRTCFVYVPRHESLHSRRSGGKMVVFRMSIAERAHLMTPRQHAGGR